MTNFDDLLDHAKDVAQTAGDKAQDFINIAKINVEISDINRKLTKNFANLGILYYKSIKDNTNESEKMDPIIEELDLLKKELADKKNEITSIKNTKKCLVCGAQMPLNETVCPKCGAENQ